MFLDTTIWGPDEVRSDLRGHLRPLDVKNRFDNREKIILGLIYHQNVLPSMTFQKNGNFRDHFFGIQDMLEAAIVIQFLQFLV